MIALVLTTVSLNPVSAKLGQPPFLNYDLSFTGVAQAGRSIVLVNNFENVGVDLLQVLALNIWADFGNLTLPPLSMPFNISLGQGIRVELGTFIPLTVVPGNHSLTAVVEWRYHNETLGGWAVGDPIVVEEPMPLQSVTGGQTPLDLISLLSADTIRGLLFGLVGYLAFSTALVLLFARREEKRRKIAVELRTRES